MAVLIRKPFVLAVLGTSLTSGRLASPPRPWDIELAKDLRTHTSCKGEVIVHSMGKGSQTSNWGVTQAPIVSALRPTHVLFEGFGINDCAMGVSLAQAASNFDSIVASLRAGNPDVVLCHQTMSPAGASDSFRTNLQAYYDQELARAGANSVESLNHTPNWPSPLPSNITFELDGLHPIWSNGTQGFAHYSYPNILFWATAQIINFWADEP